MRRMMDMGHLAQAAARRRARLFGKTRLLLLIRRDMGCSSRRNGRRGEKQRARLGEGDPSPNPVALKNRAALSRNKRVHARLRRAMGEGGAATIVAAPACLH